VPAPATATEIRDVNTRYHDGAAAGYDAKWGIDYGEVGQAQVLGKVRKALGEVPHVGRALEIGAGTGYFTLNLLQSGVVGEAVCTDISPGMLDALRANADRLGLDVETVACDAEDLPFPDASFDLVFGHAVLHHLPGLDRAFSEFRRVLRPGGRLMVLDFSTPNTRMLTVVHYLIYFVLMPALGWAVAWHRDAHHYTSDSIRTWMSRDELSKAMLEAGFVDARYISLSTGFATVHFGFSPADQDQSGTCRSSR
jgi:ubiquinone/menaquinone biosynthesis C-methylase UbiE